MSRRTIRAMLTAAALLAPAFASAQTQRPVDPNGPLVLQPISESWVISPDVKITPLKHTNQAIVGASIGKMMEDTFFIGAAGYGLVNGVDGMRMGYIGFQMGWVFSLGPRVSVQARGLFGFGAAGVPIALDDLLPVPVGSPLTTKPIRIRTDFTIGEPQVDLRVRLSRKLSLTAGAGYRLIGHADGFARWLRGVTGNVGLQVNLK